jgi:GDPmannose 4,6-dehydratase
MWKMLQIKKPNDFVISTGQGLTVRKFVEKSFKNVDINIQWTGKGIREIGICKKTKKTLVKINKKYFRPNEVEYLIGDSAKARKYLKWNPKIKTDKLIKIMMDYDLKYADYGFDN